MGMEYENYAERIKPFFYFKSYKNWKLTRKKLSAFLLKKEK